MNVACCKVRRDPHGGSIVDVEKVPPGGLLNCRTIRDVDKLGSGFTR